MEMLKKGKENSMKIEAETEAIRGVKKNKDGEYEKLEKGKEEVVEFEESKPIAIDKNNLFPQNTNDEH